VLLNFDEIIPIDITTLNFAH